MANQQKYIIALCLFGFVACAYGQSFDWQSCSSSARKEIESYRSRLQSSAQKFVSGLQESGNQALDTSSFQEDIDKLTQSMSNLTDMSNFDASRFLNTYLENIRTVSSLMRNSLRLSVMSGAMNQYIDFGNTIYSLNTNLLQRVTNACMPNTRGLVLPAQ